MTVIAQLRNNLRFDSLEDYNCSLAFPPTDWSTRGTARPIFGTVCIIFCLTGIVPYISCMPTLWELRKHACYKMMFILCIVDLLTLLGLSMGGLVFIVGGMYCHAPRISFLIGWLTCGSFFSSCNACFMIAVNRFVELFDIRPMLKLYTGNRPWLLMIIPALYGYIPMFISPFASANSEAHLYLIDPLIFSDNRYEYTSYFLLANNFTMPTLSSFFYLTMILAMCARRKSASTSQHSSAQRATMMLSIQCGVIVVFHMSTMLGYAFLQLIRPSAALQYAAHISWILMHGIPPYVYFLFNSAIRKSVLKISTSAMIPMQTTSNKLSSPLTIDLLVAINLSMPQVISQFRNNLLFESFDEYNCSAAPFDWSTRGTPRPVFGAICILFCCVGIGPYLACMPILWDMRKQACYKMMFILAIFDIGTLVGNIFGGLIFVAGGMFCHAPKTFYAVSFLAVGCFFSSCCACLMIAINRFVELFNIRPLLKLYQGNRPWILMIIPVLYGVTAMLCTPFTQANSEAHLFLLDPMIYEGKYEYTSYFLVINNFASPSLSTSLYLIMICRIVTKRGSMSINNAANRAAIMLSIQCGVIVVFHASTCLGYVGLQFYPYDILCYAMHLSWIVMHGLPPFVYVAFNASIRRGIMQIATPTASMQMSSAMRLAGSGGTSTMRSGLHSVAPSAQSTAF